LYVTGLICSDFGKKFAKPSYFDNSMGGKRDRETENHSEDPCEDLEISLVGSSGNPDFIIDIWKGVSHI
jgi:hypothetical protein